MLYAGEGENEYRVVNAACRCCGKLINAPTGIQSCKACRAELQAIIEGRVSAFDLVDVKVEAPPERIWKLWEDDVPAWYEFVGPIVGILIVCAIAYVFEFYWGGKLP